MAAASSDWWSFRTIRAEEHLDPAVRHLGLGRSVVSRGDQGHGVVLQLDGRVGRQDLEHLPAAVFLVHDIDATSPEGQDRERVRTAQAAGQNGLDPDLGRDVEADDRPCVELDLAAPVGRRPDGVARTDGRVEKARFGLGTAFAEDRGIRPLGRRLDVADVAEIEVFRTVDDPVLIGPPKAGGRGQNNGEKDDPPDPPVFHGRLLVSLIFFPLS